jgi:hypothetical protein
MAIAKEVGSAEWGGYLGGSGAPSGSASDGLGDPVVNISPVSYITDDLSSGTHYQSETPNGDGSVTITISQSATATGSGSGVQLSINVPSVTPVEVDVAGTTLDENHNPTILVGQAFDASINLPDGATATNSTWSINGGIPIYYFDATQGLPPTSWNPSNETNNNGTTHCYFISAPASDNTAVTVTCNTHYNFPAGTLPAAGLDVSANKNIYVCAPDYHLKPTVTALQSDPTILLSAGWDAGKVYCTMSWNKTTVTTPDIYSYSGVDYGQWNIFQIITSGRTYNSYLGDLNEFDVFSIAGKALRQTGTPLVNAVGNLAADCTIPYADDRTLSANGKPDGEGDVPSESISNNVFTATKTVTSSSGETTTLTREFILTQANVSDDFTDYLMYMPPPSGAGDSIWVPLSMFTWGWAYSFDETPIVDGTWWVDPTEIPYVSDPIDTSEYPTWDYLIGDSDANHNKLTFIDSDSYTF